MDLLSVSLGTAFILIILWDAFETIVLPRRVTRRIRFARFFYRSTWRPYSKLVGLMSSLKRRESCLSFFGPISLLILLTVWASGLIVGFALIFWAEDSALQSGGIAHGFFPSFYMSGTNFFTLGLGDITPRTVLARLLVMIEAGMGFGFLALVIGYLPVLNQLFSRREVNVSLMDARAGSPPTAAEMLCRHSCEYGLDPLRQRLSDWERWAAELLESHLSYPVLALFRSQHYNQSWLATLTVILDTCALVMTCVEWSGVGQAKLTFAMARHTVVDLSLVFGLSPSESSRDRLSLDGMRELRARLASAGLNFRSGDEIDQNLAKQRRTYEPYVHALSQFLCITVPPFVAAAGRRDDWETGTRGPGRNEDEHF